MRRLRAVRPSQERWRWTYLSSIERSERNASIDNIERSAKGLGVDACKLLRDN